MYLGEFNKVIVESESKIKDGKKIESALEDIGYFLDEGSSWNDFDAHLVFEGGLSTREAKKVLSAIDNELKFKYANSENVEMNDDSFGRDILMVEKMVTKKVT